MNKKYLIVLDENIVTRLDSYVMRPCSRSDIINDALVYLLDHPNIIQSFVEKRNNMRDIPSERTYVKRTGQRTNHIGGKCYCGNLKQRSRKYCEICRIKVNRINQVKYNENTIKWRKINKLKIYNHYSNYDIKCNCCGERHIEFLSIDHINRDGGLNRKKQGVGSVFYRWLIKNNFPPGFQILCMNCNHSRSRKNNPDGICIHQKEKADAILSI